MIVLSYALKYRDINYLLWEFFLLLDWRREDAWTVCYEACEIIL